MIRGINRAVRDVWSGALGRGSGIVAVAVAGNVALEALGGIGFVAERAVGVWELAERKDCDLVNLLGVVLGAVRGPLSTKAESLATSDEGLLSMIDQRRRRRLVLLRPIELAAVGDAGSSEAGLGTAEFADASKIASCGRVLPRGGRSGIRLSMRACARLMWPSTSSSSSSSATNGVSGFVVLSAVGGVGSSVSACLRLMGVGAGEGSGAGIVLDRARERSRVEGRLRLTLPEGAREGTTGTGTGWTLPGWSGGDIEARLLDNVALVRSSRWEPLGPAATGSMASSSLDSAQSALESSCDLDGSAVRVGAAARTLLTEAAREADLSETNDGLFCRGGLTVVSDGLA